MKKSKKESPKTKLAFELSKAMKNKLPIEERNDASALLWEKSAGKCALCSLPLDLATKDSVVPDHYIPEAKEGATTLSNLYLAHRTCNASRQHLPFEIARPLVRFRSLADQEKSVDFDKVIDEYVPSPHRQLVGYEEIGPGSAQISFGFAKFVVPLGEDPATKVKYFFVDVPTEYIHNDAEIQPRAIMPAHVRKLAVDFTERPVHEPSNCRLVMESATTARLLQFDGQHKTTAQVLIGRKSAPMKIYVAPSIDMLQSLVIKIQQEIKKQPLTKSETLAKIGDVVRRYVGAYSEPAGKQRSERGLIARQPKTEQKELKKAYLDDLRGLVFFEEGNLLTQAVRPGASSLPTTDKVVIEKIIGPLFYSKLLDTDLDASVERDEERKNILIVLNAIAEAMLPPGWDAPGNELQKLRAQNFFYQGSIGWWMNEILEPALRYVLYKVGDDKPLFLHPMDESDKERVLSLVGKLCAWPIWSTTDPEALKAMRSNTVKNVVEVFAEYSDKKLIKEI